MDFILAWLSNLVISTIESTGYAGIAFLMALESANIPIPSEIIMPFSGFLVFQGKLNLFWVVFWGAAGNLLGSLVSYYLGFFGGRPLIDKCGRFLLIHKKDLEISERWFARFGTSIIFFSRVLPVVRTFISFPAGIARMPILKFSLYTFAGSFIWSYILTYAGVVAGENWSFLEPYFRKFDWLIVVLGAIAAAWWLWRHSNVKIKA